MNDKINNWLNLTFQLVTLVGVFAAPLLFWHLTTDYYEPPKLLLTLAVAGLLLVLWLGKCIANGRLIFSRTPLDLPFLLIIIVAAISTFFAVSRSVAIFGNFPRLYGSLISLVTIILFYFTLVSNLTTNLSLERRIVFIKQMVYALLFTGVILATFTLASYFGINLLSLPLSSAINFTPTGNSFSTTAILALLLPFPLLAIMQSRKEATSLKLSLSPDFLSIYIQKLILSLVLTLFTAAVVLTGTTATLVASAAAFLLVLFATPSASLKKNAAFLALPIIAAATLAIFSFAQISFDSSLNTLHTKASNFPRELQLPFQTSWKISVSAFRDSPFWGSGPASYLFDFTFYKPVEINNTKLWNIRFDQPFNEYLNFLATLGAMGFISLLLLTFILLSLAFKTLSKGKSGTSLAISSIIFFVLLALHSATFILWAVGIVILALFVTASKQTSEEVHLGVAPKGKDQLLLRFDTLPAFILLIALVIIGALTYFTSQFLLADIHHRQALNAVTAGSPVTAYKELMATEKLNIYIDLYRTDLAQTNFALANAIAVTKGPSEASPAGSLTDQDKQNIQTFLSQSINAGKVATVLSPTNPLNWEVLGAIYHQISGVAQNALAFSLDSYGRAIQRDPLNPQLRITVGGIYYANKNYDMAIRFFSDAINLKPDMANGYYNLALAFKEKGDLKAAQAMVEKTISLVDPSSPDYQVATKLLASFKDQTITESTNNQPLTNLQSEASKSSALQKKNMPKVLNLPKPEKIATPEAVKKQN